MVKKNNKRKKEEIAEDYCFVCKDGGEMRVCDFGDCLKTYHAECVKQDASFLKNDDRWCCASHSCYQCGGISKFMCLCCTIAFCGKCFYGAEFALVKGNKGFCRHCSKLAFLIEKNADVDSDGEKVDMRDPDTIESYFFEYYQVIKKKEGLNSQDVYTARDIIKNGKNKYEVGEGEDDTGESDASDFIGSDCDDLVGTSRVKSVRRKKCSEKLKSIIKGKVVKHTKKDFVGWGSRSLIDFLKSIGRDTTEALSELDVAWIIIQYCHTNQLFDPKKKKIVICDAKLRNLLRRRSVNKNNIQNLLESHFADNFEETDGIITSSEERDNGNGAFKFPKQGNLNSTTKPCQNILSEEQPSVFAAIINSNMKLVYLKRSLIEELLKQPETFDGKVLGSYVRTKSDPNDYLQKNSHLLLQVIGIKRSSKQADINQEILLRLSYVPKDVPISQISDVDFSEHSWVSDVNEECQDLYQRMTNGMLKKPTVLELEQKARSLHEDITKHWISREMALLQHRIDLANEKGRRREYPFMICLLMLPHIRS
ncbi:putative chromatin regulator PHD family [Medicago truncatula]|uniref:Putative chromatin regulator PHD family n=1 Tax=Medicago truncatula TaxID=3880 RepID=A0A396IQP4_MEDTR|nr:putative chromatin regulator PHD family [Medicago truncatula]